MELNLKSDGTVHQNLILDYLKNNVSETLAEKINTGKKTLAGCYGYIREEAHSRAKDGCACISDEEVYGWAIHFFEEDAIEESKKTTNSQEGVKKSQEVKKQKVETPDEKLKRLIKEDKKKAEPKKEEMLKDQMTIFDFGFEG